MAARRLIGLFENGRRLGVLTRTPSGLALQYDADWLGLEQATPVSLSLPLDPAGHRGEKVFRFLENLLPDSEAVRARLAVRVDAPDTHPFTLLERLGRCSAGALTFVPEGEDPGPPGSARGAPVSDEEVERLVCDLDSRPLGVGRRFRISLAGAQRKTALLFADGAWRRPAGFTPTTHILKPQIGSLMGVDFSRSVENEFLCLALASALGLEVASARIADFGNARVLVVERFDRRWTEDGRLLRVPHEDFAQALSVPTGRKYELDGGPGMTELLDLLGGSVRPERDRRAFLRAQIVFWLLAGIDGHAKNYSLRLLPGGRFRLAPLYDVTSVQPALAAATLPPAEAPMSLGVGKSGERVVDRIQPHHFAETGEMAGVPARVVRGVFEELIEARAGAFESVGGALPEGFPADIAAPVFEGVTSRLRQAERYLTG
jgi:serine/threonine-protein kinase HipA